MIDDKTLKCVLCQTILHSKKGISTIIGKHNKTQKHITIRANCQNFLENNQIINYERHFHYEIIHLKDYLKKSNKIDEVVMKHVASKFNIKEHFSESKMLLKRIQEVSGVEILPNAIYENINFRKFVLNNSNGIKTKMCTAEPELFYESAIKKKELKDSNLRKSFVSILSGITYGSNTTKSPSKKSGENTKPKSRIKVVIKRTK
ncbi:hypothetical protein ECANGB1_1021 [Enterospora canceri]|uniref:Uncharacterized protein n=1 Tax=Enterospora canceri TaxID=1081671 RepID=A0A1Y1S856_9MICR|nr:hypothetical protein ECANGB1_1021 [Enterospora canceri]